MKWRKREKKKSEIPNLLGGFGDTVGMTRAEKRKWYRKAKEDGRAGILEINKLDRKS